MASPLHIYGRGHERVLRSARRSREAARKYRERQDAIVARLDSIAKKLDRHAEGAARDPRNWGYAGDLGHVEELLREVDEFLNPTE